MAEHESLYGELDEALESAPLDETPRARERRYGRLGFGRVAGALAILALVMALAFGILWTQRERIADNVIGRELKSRGIPATYRVERVGADRKSVV